MSNNPRQKKAEGTTAPGEGLGILEAGATEYSASTDKPIQKEGSDSPAKDDAAEAPDAADARPSVKESSPDASGSLKGSRKAGKIRMAIPDVRERATGRSIPTNSDSLGASGASGTSGTLSDSLSEADKAVLREDEKLAKKRKAKRKRVYKIIRRTLIALVLLAIIGIVSAFAMFRWTMYDDHADLQGTWVMEGTEVPIEITEDEIRLTDGVAYSYMVDPDTKQLVFTFGNMMGQAHYRFSLDRNELAIEDGEVTWLDSTLEDSQWLVNALFGKIRDGEGPSPGTNGTGKQLLKRA